MGKTETSVITGRSFGRNVSTICMNTNTSRFPKGWEKESSFYQSQGTDWSMRNWPCLSPELPGNFVGPRSRRLGGLCPK